MPYDISIKKVVLAGASGNLGAAVLKELLASDLFEITVLTRQNSTHTFPPGVQVKYVDYTSSSSLSDALAGQDALVSTVATASVPIQRILIDAAVAAGIKRIIPSEFGCDLKNPKTRSLPVFAGKVAIEDYLDELAIKGLTSYTLIFTGPFIDLGLRNGLYFDFNNRKATIYNGGDQLISVSRLATAGKAVRRVLTHPRETADRAVWVKDIDISQNQLLKLAQSLTHGQEWELSNVNTETVEAESLKAVSEGKAGPNEILGQIRVATFDERYGNRFKHDHNAVLGIRGLTGPDLEELPRSIFGVKK